MKLNFSQFQSIESVCDHLGTVSLGIKRADMPQISAEHLDDFIKWLNDRGISSSTIQVTGKDLRPSQCEFNPEKVKSLLSNESKSKIIISEDFIIVDGHHRYIKNYITGEILEALQIHAPFEEIIKLIHEYDNVFYKKVNEQHENRNPDNQSRS